MCAIFRLYLQHCQLTYLGYRLLLIEVVTIVIVVVLFVFDCCRARNSLQLTVDYQLPLLFESTDRLRRWLRSSAVDVERLKLVFLSFNPCKSHLSVDAFRLKMLAITQEINHCECLWACRASSSSPVRFKLTSHGRPTSHGVIGFGECATMKLALKKVGS